MLDLIDLVLIDLILIGFNKSSFDRSDFDRSRQITFGSVLELLLQVGREDAESVHDICWSHHCSCCPDFNRQQQTDDWYSHYAYACVEISLKLKI